MAVTQQQQPVCQSAAPFSLKVAGDRRTPGRFFLKNVARPGAWSSTIGGTGSAWRRWKSIMPGAACIRGGHAGNCWSVFCLSFRCFDTSRTVGTQCNVCTRLPVVVLAWGWWIGRIFPMGRGHATCRRGSRTTAFHPVAQFRSFTQTAREWSGETP
jgi:hypothetical protein